jgi:putative aldouronate transport system permease protein
LRRIPLAKKEIKRNVAVRKAGYIEKGGIKALPHNIATDFKRNKTIYFLCIPIVLWYIIFCYLPMGGLVMAFQRYNVAKGIMGSKFVGFDNFIRFFTGPYFGRVMRNTTAIGLLDLVLGFPAPIIFALFLNEVRNKSFKKVVQTTSYMPYFISMVVIAGLIKDFTQSGGVISNLVASITNSSAVNLLGDSKYFWWIYVFSGIWQGFGYGSIIYMASLSSIDQQLYEAAVMDGANRWKQTLHITLPGLAPTITILLIMRMGSLFSVGSDKILLLYSPAIYETADVINTYVYRVGLVEMNYGFSAAVGLFNSVVGTAFLLVTNAICRKYSDTSLF